ncbi:MAG TPA: hypothetical protein VNA16_06935, partial [Abditibacteriaceae bacterium]|nr:hypothetical protein [Abditibacteriaceae bacterium]
IEPGQPLRREDALRIAKPFNADWVVYGEVKEMRARKKRGAFKSSKNLFATLRLAVADCKTDELFYWKSRTDKVGGSGVFGGFQLKGTKLIRLGALVGARNNLEPLLQAMPRHDVKGPLPDNDALLKFMVQTWPDLAKDG